ncbi:ribonuclease H-like protein [Macrolepiota fuliginosa MF-IS2]|uniref:Ribonuclease H-like protein n=1 Tax=Macrolepiota fuliginosa MF-IS2 TaxID=1400762 RepID=A0A9P5XAF2_9AGAR|nr:ribonuclease H-like protein [Macrolepiota fuliginosa MF-IS2]
MPEAEPPLKRHSKSVRDTRTGNSGAARKQSTVISLEEEEAPSEGTLPIYSYKDYGPKPCVVYTRNEEEANDLVDSLKPGFVCPLTLWFPVRLQALIENAAVPKVGVNILNDGKKLFKDYGIMAKNLVELGSVALVVDPAPVAKRKIVSLAKLVEHYYRKTLSKGPERTSDWEKPLSKKQREYAANDAHASLMVYNQLLKLSEQNSCPLDNDTQSQYAKDVTWALGTSLLPQPESRTQPTEGMRPQYLRAYEYWHHRKLSLEEMCVKLSLKNKGPVSAGESIALKPGDLTLTISSYVLYALQNEPKLEFQPKKIVELVQMDLNSWNRHCIWIAQHCTV